MFAKRLLFVLTLGPIAGALLGVLALEPRAARADNPTVVELFTSQSCYSCPPAERFLGELAAREGILALEFHVDYWDDLVYGKAGQWRDPFSNPAYSERQRDYNRKIRGRPSVYTPQMVIDGRFEVVGSRVGAVEDAIERAQSRRGPRIAVAATTAGNGLSVSLKGGPKQPGEIWLVSYLRREVTRVLRGENHGKVLVNYCIVTDLRRVGDWTGEDKTIQIGGVRNEERVGCAVLVQAGAGGPILGAASCPAVGS